ncbi:flagellar basal body P-ring protein FlgI [Legionella nagasakiensis]|uniref:flagellar basal body P-ring protein FlgI n=1 Tax=Legionella nagasakiensis TaxID=535290 RepID=UPI003BF7E551
MNKVFIVLFMVVLIAVNSQAARIKDITTLAGVRENQLVGYGLVVGLDGTGDRTAQAPFTDQTFRNMLLQFGIRLPAGKNVQLRNVAAVSVSAMLPPFARIGQKIDVTISSLGNAPSLRGGTLLMVPLRGADNQVYAMAQGNVVVSGFGARGADGSKVTVNVTASGRIANGATVEKTIESPYVHNGVIVFELNNPDFTTARRIAETINRELGYKAAQPLDAGAVAVQAGSNYSTSKGNYLKRNSYVSFISDLENLKVMPGESAARVVVNSRSGTIVVGQDVTISPIAISHGNLSISVSETPFVSQPGPFSDGRTVQGKDSDVKIDQQKGRAFVFAPGPSLKEIVNALNKVGVAPGDLISILEAIKQAGALHADLEVI